MWLRPCTSGMVPRSRAYQSMGSRRKQPRPAPFAEQARCRPCGPSGRGGPSGPSGRPCPNDFKRLKRIRGVCSSSAGRPGSPSAGSALLLDLSARAALAGRFQWEGAFPGAASRVPRDLPRAILGRPFGAAHRIPRVGAAPRGCPSGSNGDTLSRRGRHLEHVPVLRWWFRTLWPFSCSSTGSRGCGIIVVHTTLSPRRRKNGCSGRRIDACALSP